MFYVTCHDTFLSGWGCSDNKINKLLLKCETIGDAIKLADWIRDNREEMQYINVAHKPAELRKTFGNEYVVGKFFVQIKSKDDMPYWYKQAGIK